MTTCFFGWLHKGHNLRPDMQDWPDDPLLNPNNGIVGHDHFLAHSDSNYHQHEKLSIGYSGNFRWADQTVQTVADKQGNGKSIQYAYAKHGKDFLNQLRGSFAIALIEPEENYALLAIDRMGIQRLVYRDNAGFAFSNSLKTLNKYTGEATEISMQSIYNYMYFHMIPSPDSIFQGIHKIEPGHCVEYRQGQTIQRQYWQPDFEKNNTDSLQHQSKLLHQVMSRATEMHTQPDVGAFLSGGLDSSTVSGFLSKARPHAKTFSIGFDADGYDETEYARIASKHFGTDHYEYYVTPEDVLNIIPRVAQAYDEPFGNSSAIPAYYCAKLAKENGCHTLLAGDGGDEIFGGNERYVKQKLFETYLKLPKAAQKLNQSLFSIGYLDQIPGVNKVKSFIRQAHVPLPDRMENYNFLHQMHPGSIFTNDLIDATDTNYPIRHLRQRFNEPVDSDYLDRMLYLDWKRTLADNDLRKVNEMCALAGIDVHYPMLDDELVAFSCTIPSERKIKGLKIRHFYKQAMSEFLPEEILNKSKHGFGLPFGIWMKTHPALQDMAYDAIGQLKALPYFNPEFLDRAVEMHRSGHSSYYGELIWILMMLSLWLEKHVN